MSTQTIPFSRSVKRVAGPWLVGPILLVGLLSAGDRSVFSAGAANTGIDPLEILNLSVRPNAIFVLDSSVSMAETLTGDTIGADHPDSKLAVAKSVINTIVAANETRVSFQFGRYIASATTLKAGNQTTQNAASARFDYTVADPSFTTEPDVQLRLFEVPSGSAWTVTFANGNTVYTTAAIPAGVYTGTELAEQMATLMNSQHSASYTGTFSDPADAASPAFTFTRGTGTLPFTIRFQSMNSTLRALLRAVSTESNDVTGPAYSIQPHVGSLTSFTLGTAGPNSFIVSGSPTIQVTRGTTYSGQLTDGTYTGAALATHIATRMNAIDTAAVTTSVPNSFTIPSSPAYAAEFRRTTAGGTNTTYSFNLTPGTYTGDGLATHIANLVNSADTATNAEALYTGSYDEATGVFTFGRGGSFTTHTFTIRWANWTSALRTLMGTPTSNVTDSSSPYSLTTNGGLSTPTTNASYAGSYTSATGVFTFTRTGADVTNAFGIPWSSWTPALRTLIGAPAVNGSDGSSSPYSLATSGVLVDTTTTGSTSNSSGASNSTAPLVLYRRNDSATYEFTSGGKTYYSLMANKFFNGQTLSVLPNGTPCYLITGTPDSSPDVTIQSRGTCSGAVTDTVTFPLAGPTSWDGVDGDVSCGGFQSLVSLASCTNNAQFATISAHTQPELSAPGGSLPGYAETATGTLVSQPTVTGIRATSATPIAESLIDVRSVFNTSIWPTVAAQTKKQRTYVIFLTDGDDSCANSTTFGFPTDTDNGPNLRSAHKAEMLYRQQVSGQPASSVTTFVVALGSGASVNRANWVAWGGSGMHIDDTGADETASTRWASVPTSTQRTACTTCVDAFLATDTASLSAALQSAIDLGQTAGEFSDQQSITETVYEYVSVVPAPTPIASPSPTTQPSPYHPLNPITRYGSSLPVLLQSTFDMPTFNGHLKAFRNIRNPAYVPTPTPAPGATPAPFNPSNPEFIPQQLWDAATKLNSRVTTDTGAMGSASYSFAALYGTAFDPAANPSGNIRTSTARIKRRIYTTLRQGVLFGYTSQNLLNASASVLAGPLSTDPKRVQLWPPEGSIAPTANNPAPPGDLDGPLGLLAPATKAAVQALVPGACQGSVAANIFGECTGSTAVALARTRREAREILLAFVAGAKVLTENGLPLRNPTTRELQYVARPWIMAESTLAAPAVVTPPLLSPTLTYRKAEYLLFRDGPRDTQFHAVDATQNGLGLRNPDLENPQTASSRDNLDLKPQMSVVYHATNQGLHAFRAGPCPTSLVSGGLFGAGAIACAGETGGEELWAFIPFDQLGKVSKMAQIQSRANKTYLLAAPVRITDVFVPGEVAALIGNVNVGVKGVWRTLAIFGRGIGGKSLTALDVTVPGPFTRHSLDTNPPIVVWSRGNFDTSDGLAYSAATNFYNHDVADYNAYLGMGETWSVPAVGFVNPATHPTARRPSGIEFVMYLGSGYTDSSSEGKTFFALDLLTGDVFRSFAIPDGTTATTVSGSPLRNVLPGSPAVYAVDDAGNSPAGFGFLSNPVEAKAKFVYFGDLHSRIWRYVVATPTVAPTVMAALHGDGDQPFASPIALLESSGIPNLFFSGGKDSRVPVRTNSPRFRMYGYTDATGTTPAGPVTQLFARDFPEGYRGNSNPAAAFTGGDLDNNPSTPPVYAPVVFFTGLATAGLVGEPCTSSFNSVLFALKGLTGLAAFDLNSASNLEADDAYAVVTAQVLQTPHITSEGTLVIDRGLNAGTAPPPPAAPITAELPPQSQVTSVVYGGLTPGTDSYKLLRATTVPLRSGTAVCNVK